jgi:hypothetical protein
MHVSAWTGPYLSATRTGDGFAVEQRMPLARYFLCVGGVLLALLFIVDAYLPKFPVAAKATANSPVIRILSDRKWPERIVYDTSLPTVVPAQIANIEAKVAAPEIVASTAEREAFAQLQPSSQLFDAKKIEPKPQRHHKIAKRRAAPPARLAARQMQFGWFGNRIW